MQLQAAPIKSSGLSFRRKSEVFVGNENLELSGINVRNLEPNRPLLDPFTKIFLNLQLVAAFHLFS
jgi:hypothetical protein